MQSHYGLFQVRVFILFKLTCVQGLRLLGCLPSRVFILANRQGIHCEFHCSRVLA